MPADWTPKVGERVTVTPEAWAEWCFAGKPQGGVVEMVRALSDGRGVANVRWPSGTRFLFAWSELRPLEPADA